VEVKKADLLATVVRQDQYPHAGPPEIAFAGRSNVGKSSLLNLITNRRHLAKVSGSPGKTQTINFYSINGDQFRIVDLPGYGYARVSKSVSGGWGAMVETYLAGRDTLKGVFVLIDIRREPTAQDRQLCEYLAHHGLPAFIVATKSDKVSSNERARQIAAIRKGLGVPADELIVCVSALKRSGVGDLLEVMEAAAGASGDMVKTAFVSGSVTADVAGSAAGVVRNDVPGNAEDGMKDDVKA
jgi:GTP-binding protein